MIQGATAKHTEIEVEARKKFEELDVGLPSIYFEATKKFMEKDDTSKKNISVGGKGTKRSALLPKKMMILKTFDMDIAVWRKWKDEVKKYFDDENEGMKGVTKAVARSLL